MWMRVVYLLEVLATLSCIHSIYGEKIRWGIKSIALCMSLLVILEYANSSPSREIYSLLVYLPIIVYCKYEFESSLLQIFVRMVWFIILLAVMEFICAFLVACIIPENVLIRNIIVNFLVLVLSLFILPRMHISKIKLQTRIVKILLGVIFCVVCVLVLEGKLTQKINMVLFAFAIPTILILLYALVRWSILQTEVDNIKRDISIADKMEKNYTEIVDDIRIRQHGFKNHITAILSARYTYQTYERLVEVQDEYCNKLMHENRYNDLLQIGDKVLVGFLYDKFQEIEGEGIEVKYKISASITGYTVPVYHLIEILGILLDNATEAVKNGEKKTIILEVSKFSEKFLFSIRNESRYVPYEEIESWFRKGVSNKGKNRGLGLYYVKRLCQEFNCVICCKNVEKDENNWIEFCLEIDKADRE